MMKIPLTHFSPNRMRFYLLGLAFTAVSVPFIHVYMNVKMSAWELTLHTILIVSSAALVSVMVELAFWAGFGACLPMAGNNKLRRRGPWRPWLLSGLTVLAIVSCLPVAVALFHGILNSATVIFHKHEMAGYGYLHAVPIILLVLTITMLVYRSPKKPAPGSRGVSQKTIVFHLDRETCRVAVSWIVRVQADENYCHVYFDRQLQGYGSRIMIRMTLKEAAARLGDGFVQVHRSHLVNRDCMAATTGNSRQSQLHLHNGEVLPVSRNRIKLVNRACRRQAASAIAE